MASSGTIRFTTVPDSLPSVSGEAPGFPRQHVKRRCERHLWEARCLRHGGSRIRVAARDSSCHASIRSRQVRSQCSWIRRTRAHVAADGRRRRSRRIVQAMCTSRISPSRRTERVFSTRIRWTTAAPSTLRLLSSSATIHLRRALPGTEIPLLSPSRTRTASDLRSVSHCLEPPDTSSSSSPSLRRNPRVRHSLSCASMAEPSDCGGASDQQTRR